MKPANVTYNVIKSNPDHKVLNFSAVFQDIQLPTSVDLRPGMPDVYNQGETGSCFVGDTIIPLLNGKNVKIKDLAEGKEGNTFWVYSIQNGRIVPGKATASKTGINKKLVKVTLDNGEQIICTPDHNFLTRDDEYIPISEIKNGTSLMPFYRKKATAHRKYEIVFCQDDNKYHYTHWLSKNYVEEKPKQIMDDYIVIHHIDFDKYNNNPDNLQYMTNTAHTTYHTSLADSCFSKWNGSEEQRQHCIKNALRMHEENPGWNLEGASKGGKAAWEIAKKDPIKKEEVLNNLKLGNSKESREKAAISLSIYYENPENVKKRSDLGKKNWENMDDEIRDKFHDIGLNLAENSIKFQSLKIGRRVFDSNLELNEENYTKIRNTFTVNGILNRTRNGKTQSFDINRNSYPKYQTALKQFESNEHFQIACENYNCKLLTVEPLNYKEDVYCLNVPEFENFALDVGVFVHNCTGNASAAAFEYDMMQQKENVFEPSRLFIYYNERLIEGTVNSDSGAQIHDAIKVLTDYGVCDELVWPYVESQFATKPSDIAYQAALNHKAKSYYQVNVDLNQMKQALAQNHPIIGGIVVFQEMESQEVAQTGIVPMPSYYDQALGGHAILFVGYNDITQTLLVRNSWGADWGMAGYFTLPYSYVNDQLMQDLWVLSAVQ
jgi:hypothetical protein